MLLRTWLVTRTETGFRASKYVSGHDGMKMVTPGLTGEVHEAATLEELGVILAALHYERLDNGPTLATFRRNRPDLLEMWI